MLELGYAVKTIGWENVILVMNTTFGGPESLPFDLRKRAVVGYALQKGQDKQQERNRLTTRIEGLLERSLEIEYSDTNAEAIIEVVFADYENQRSLGLSIEIEGTLLTGIEYECIPDHTAPKTDDFTSVISGLHDYNSEYYRSKYLYMFFKSLCKPVSFGVHNSSKNLLTGVRLVIEIPKSTGIVLLDKYPELPWKSRNNIRPLQVPSIVGSLDVDKVQATEDRSIISIPLWQNANR